jgi:Rad3-related DNA helicase
MSRDILSFFPTNDHIKGPRKSQTQVLEAIDKAFKDGYKNVLLEAPVGSGKSAIAMAAAGFYGGAHILTPRKSLQDQYLEDFQELGNMALMKGRNAYPCTYPSQDKSLEYNRVIKLIQQGGIAQPSPGQRTCDKGECKNNGQAFQLCTGSVWDSRAQEMIPGEYPCPYHVAIDVAQRKPTVIHNLHSFIFQSYFAGRFEPRQIMIIDECHEIEDIVRGFAEVKITIKMLFEEGLIPTRQECKTLTQWGTWFSQFVERFSNRQRIDGTTERGDFEETIDKMTAFSDSFGEEFVFRTEPGEDGRSTRFVFIPKNIGHLVSTYLLNYGDKRLLMSGTIYNKALFCQKNGLVESETCFMRIGSSFPLENRPIYFKDDYKVDTSHKTWDKNFVEMIQKIVKVMNIFDDAKGLIHTPSYQASLTIYNALKSTGRVMMHTKDDFNAKLNEFYNSRNQRYFCLLSVSKVLISSTIGPDSKSYYEFRMRTPLIPFVEHLVKEDFPKYNHQALVVFGQQIGRVNRADDDYGVTVLMDERFGKFLSRNRNILPKWLMDGVIYK